MNALNTKYTSFLSIISSIETIYNNNNNNNNNNNLTRKQIKKIPPNNEIKINDIDIDFDDENEDEDEDENENENENKNNDNKRKEWDDNKTIRERGKNERMDEIKRLSVMVEEEVLENATVEYNERNKIFVIDMEKMRRLYNSIRYDESKYKISVIYRNYRMKDIEKRDIYSGWIEVIRNKEVEIAPGNKYLRMYIEIFRKRDKFRKEMNEKEIRGSRSEYVISKTNMKIEIFVIIKKNI
jgi:hypothetical protein